MRLLFITSTRIGDAVLSSGVLTEMARRHPGARITVACGADAAPLFAALPELDRVIIIRKKKYGLHWLGLWAKCAPHFWREVVDLRRSAIAFFLPTLHRRILARGLPEGHRVEQIARGLGFDAPLGPLLWTAPEHEQAARDLMGEGPPVLAVAPIANWRGKQWPSYRFITLIRRLTGPEGILPGARVAVLGAASERVAAEPVLAEIPAERRIDLVGQADLLTALAFLRRCKLFVGNDSGLMHLAAAAGVPTLGLFGPSRDEHYAPWGTNTAVVRTPESYDELVGQPGYDRHTATNLMDGLTVERVEEAARALWRRSQRKSA